LRTLLVLVRRGREVVSKEELLKEVWPDSFVEEANLSQHIFKLRKALGDTLEGERYIVTLPGRGYRFAVPVRTITEGGDVLIAQMRSRAQVLIEEQVPGARRDPARPPATFELHAEMAEMAAPRRSCRRDRRPWTAATSAPSSGHSPECQGFRRGRPRHLGGSNLIQSK
jgi:DNA-binding winged helix-turn-helix (wHTH) protein